jgi:hypothetical protein
LTPVPKNPENFDGLNFDKDGGLWLRLFKAHGLGGDALLELLNLREEAATASARGE